MPVFWATLVTKNRHYLFRGLYQGFCGKQKQCDQNRWSTLLYLWVMKWLNFILSHSIFISICAFALCMQSFQLLHIPVNWSHTGPVFFATLGSYNFYWLISKYYFATKNRPVNISPQQCHECCFPAAGISGDFILLFTERHMLPEILVSVGLTLLYSVPLWLGSRPAYFKKQGLWKRYCRIYLDLCYGCYSCRWRYMDPHNTGIVIVHGSFSFYADVVYHFWFKGCSDW